jgi:hypothetical protein
LILIAAVRLAMSVLQAKQLLAVIAEVVVNRIQFALAFKAKIFQTLHVLQLFIVDMY